MPVPVPVTGTKKFSAPAPMVAVPVPISVPAIRGMKLIQQPLFFLSRIQKNKTYLKCFCLVISDRVELNMVNFLTRTFGDEFVFFINSTPLKIYSQSRNRIVPQIQGKRLVCRWVILLTFRVDFLSVDIGVLTVDFLLS